ncbi:hypothetical protein RIF23_11540 [Lipingzhangella sp. LS1_29]|uniref:DUF3558 domain-containing protein n=1 Tax=Lipingzhangella rawalii TaxID=2055835 RepID=A0ABU2H6K8_9ACTN|nr:hypothetical protein [Lipingzhangella rawalii]MDS1270931.1 hypothetical protein [Lipingzhangella rawalii]
MRRAVVSLAGVALVLVAGCASGFDPDGDDPCEFFTEEELERYELSAGTPVATDTEEASCRFGPTEDPGPEDRESEVERANVAYLPWDVSDIEQQWQEEWDDSGLVVEEVDDEDTRLTYRFGYAPPEDNDGDNVAECRLIADREEGSIVVRLGMFGVDDNACTTLADAAPEIEEKLRY